jgi:hypothetical protein
MKILIRVAQTQCNAIQNSTLISPGGLQVIEIEMRSKGIQGEVFMKELPIPNLNMSITRQRPYEGSVAILKLYFIMRFGLQDVPLTVI